jgi:hypothetical protein
MSTRSAVPIWKLLSGNKISLVYHTSCSLNFCKECSYIPQISEDPKIELYGSASGHTNYGVIHPETNRTRSSVTSGRIHGITMYNEDEFVLKEIVLTFSFATNLTLYIEHINHSI